MENVENKINWPYDPFLKIKDIINQENWDDNKFGIKKAYCCSIFSEIAYWNISEYELETDKRVKLIPCETYQILHSGKIPSNSSSLFQSGEFAQFHLINRYFASTTIVKTSKVIIVAIRGTQSLYDWYVNLQVSKFTFKKNDNYKFHKGFYKAIHTSFEEIGQKLNEWQKQSKVPIYVTGHSLGGAMASIFNAIFSEYFGNLYVNSHFSINSCYTFGMPRYCNLAGVVHLKNPFHIYNTMDIVPVVPPKWLGYENSRNEYRLNGQRIENISKEENYKNIKWLSKLMFINRIKEHNIELYRGRIEDLVNGKN
ncbi:lipase family protein [Aquiflexum gelatinilyticum]|uniref:lipase family protein n=1 Tax=Aquiflexum gelatinilyticum TaxID=2961943 RepID=UPI002168BECC|nr:lipase family protein [Aquiflexum gelatinilyticum]MCS4435876.1 lipase family protein [Aquiflexum gelatinilyticum]